MKSRTLIFVVIAFAVIRVSAGYAQQSAEQLFQSGLYKEEVQGELKAAIKIYGEIVIDADADRSIRAEAQLRIALCKEKLGLQEAQKEYQKVIDQYPEQQDEVAVAKERLFKLAEALEKIPHKPTFRKIQIPTTPGNGALSPDGKKFAFASEGSLWIVPVQGKVSPDIAGEPIKLHGTEGAFHSGMSWSADGKWIAYNTSENDAMGICVIPSSGGKVKRIVNDYHAGKNINNYGLGLSADGKLVAFASEEKEMIQLFTVTVDEGDVNQLTEDGGIQPAFSPDGRKIAYVKEKPQKTEISRSDVWVIAVAGGPPVQLSDLPGRATRPIWSPDGKMIAFTRKSEGGDNSKEICIAPVSDTGDSEASITQIALPLETWEFLAGWTPDNRIGVLLTNPRHQAVYTVPASGGKATQVTPQGFPFHPRWSPDGEKIYFRWDRGNIASVPSEGGKISKGLLEADSEVGVALPGGGISVSPDGKKIVFSGGKMIFKENKRDFEVDIYTIPAEGGKDKKLTNSPGQDRFPCWSPDGRSIAFVRYPEPSKEMSICIVPTEGGDIRQLTSESHRVKWSCIAWSPDGESIAYFSDDKTIKVIPVQGGESREVVKVEDVRMHSELAWSQDGKQLVYSSKGKLFVVSIEGGESEEVKTGLDARISHVDWSSDGEKMTFIASKGGDTDLWFMEDFLPELKADRK